MLQAFSLGMMRRGGWSGKNGAGLKRRPKTGASPVANSVPVPPIPAQSSSELSNRLEGGGCGGDVAESAGRLLRMWLVTLPVGLRTGSNYGSKKTTFGINTEHDRICQRFDGHLVDFTCDESWLYTPYRLTECVYLGNTCMFRFHSPHRDLGKYPVQMAKYLLRAVERYPCAHRPTARTATVSKGG